MAAPSTVTAKTGTAETGTRADETAAGAPPSRSLEIGARAEDFCLRDTQGVRHCLSSYRGRTAIVLAMTGIGCPIAELYAPRLRQIHERYRGRGLQVLGINASQQDDIKELRAFVNEHQLSFPILKDHGNVVADRLGAERTTEVFLLDSSLTLRYRGRIDDQYTITDRSVGLRKDRAEVHDLVEAIEALIAGNEVKTARTRAVGCVIGRRRVIGTRRALRGDAGVTFHGEVERILARRCQPCHRPGQIAPFALTTYEDAAGWSGMIGEVVANGRMPPWHADSRYGSFSNDRSLGAEERTTLMRWVEAGAPRGDPKDRPPPVSFPEGWQIGTPDAVFEMPTEFAVPAEGTIDYQHFTVKTSFPEDRWVRAMEVRAGNREVVHHILVFAVDPADPRGSLREFGGGVRGYFAAMVPGERPTVFPEGYGKRLPRGATLVFQVHYTPNGTAGKDRSRIGMIFSDSPVRHQVRTQSAANTKFVIPPETAGERVTARHVFSRDSELLSFLPHMHLRGSAFEYVAHYLARIKVSKPPWAGNFSRHVVERLRFDAPNGSLVWLGEMSREDLEALSTVYTSAADREALERLRKKSRTEILLRVPAYDFGWQNTYRLAEPKPMPRGTVLEARATYDNSASNPALTRDLWSSRVRWGDQTWNEMMIGYFDYVVVEPGAPARGDPAVGGSSPGEARRF
ncbi:MAG: redoxin domain-containing protein [Planctomycetota bacterium]|nr:redoxin domain-containing protein [Planctomycetota bacterium]